MKKYFAAFLAIVALAFGLAVAAPASADVVPMEAGTSVTFEGVGIDVPQTIDLYNTSNSGYEYTQSLHTVRHNVAKVCPKNDNWFLAYYGASGNYHTAGPGQCVILTVVNGSYRFFVNNAKFW